MHFCLYKYASCSCISVFNFLVSCSLSIHYVKPLTCVTRTYSAMRFLLSWIRKVVFVRTKSKAFMVILNKLSLMAWLFAFISRYQKTLISVEREPWLKISTPHIRNKILLTVNTSISLCSTDSFNNQFKLTVNKFSFHKDRHSTWRK